MNRDLFTKTYRAYMSSALTNLTKENRQIVENLNLEIKKACASIDVALYLPQEASNPATHDDTLSAEEVYILDRWRIAEAHFVLLNADCQSFGVGQEAEIACSMGIPLIIFHHKDTKVTRMLKGSPCIFISDGLPIMQPSQSLIDYRDHEELIAKLVDRINILKQSLKPEKQYSTLVDSFGKRLKRIRNSKGLDLKTLSKRTGLSVSFLSLLEMSKTDVGELVQRHHLQGIENIDIEKFTNPGLWVMYLLKEGLGVELHDLVPVPAQNADLKNVDDYLKICRDNQVTLSEFEELNREVGFKVYRLVARDTDTVSGLKKKVDVTLKKIRSK